MVNDTLMSTSVAQMPKWSISEEQPFNLLRRHALMDASPGATHLLVRQPHVPTGQPR